MIRNEDIKVIFMGTPEFSVPILKALNEASFDIIGIVTNPDKPVGRKQVLTASPVKQLATNNRWQANIFQPKTKLEFKALAPELSALKPDLIVVAAFGRIIPKEILDIPRLGAINVHASILPYLRGASPIQYAILNGNEETGITIMLMDEEMDHGPILSQSKILISEYETYESLCKKLSQLGAELLVKTIPDYIEGKIKPQEQDHSKATYTKVLKKEDGRIDWSESAGHIEKMTRAFYPWPTVYTNARINQNLKTLKIINVGVYKSESNKYQNGEVFLTASKELAVKCGKDALIIKKLQLEGNKALSAQEFSNGFKSFVGSILK